MEKFIKKYTIRRRFILSAKDNNGENAAQSKIPWWWGFFFVIDSNDYYGMDVQNWYCWEGIDESKNMGWFLLHLLILVLDL